ncbi:MAG: hypothetical protein JNL13_07820 [Chitinophagaceae bacterium]|nr:hypothetical protein [Chitinophagaceae bacterium]
MRKIILLAALSVVILPSCKKDKETPKADPKAACIVNYDYESTYNVYHKGSLDTSLTATMITGQDKNDRRIGVSLLRSKDNHLVLIMDCESKTFVVDGQPGKVGKIYADSLVIEDGDYRRVFIPRRN